MTIQRKYKLSAQYATEVSRWRSMHGAIVLAERDFLLIRRSIGDLLLRSLVQPLLFSFTFTYIYVRIGGGFGVGEHAGIATVVLPGIIGFSALFSGIFAVGMPLAVDLGITREIDDRALAPMPTTLIPVVRLMTGAVQAIAAALVVPVMIAVVAARAPDTRGWQPMLFAVALLACGLCTASIGLLMAGLVATEKLPAVLTVIHLPLTFLGAGYYPWAALSKVPVLQVAILLNPMTYVSESLRAAVTPHVAHMNPAIAISATVAWTCVMATVGARGVARRIVARST